MAAPRKPQDHKPTQAQIKEEAREALADAPPLHETPGHEFLRPLDDMDGFEQSELLVTLEGGDDPTAGLMAFGRRVRDECVVDAEGFKKFNTGPGAAGRLLNLLGAYAAEMGKGVI